MGETISSLDMIKIELLKLHTDPQGRWVSTSELPAPRHFSAAGPRTTLGKARVGLVSVLWYILVSSKEGNIFSM